MPTLIAYAGKHGSTAKYAADLAKMLPGQVKMVDLRKAPDVDLSQYDTVVLGSAIYAGQIQKELRDFSARNLAALLPKKLGLYICCWFAGEQAQKQLQAGFPAELLEAAIVKACFGGEMNLAEMNLAERLAVKLVAKVRESESHYSLAAVQEFAQILCSGRKLEAALHGAR